MLCILVVEDDMKLNRLFSTVLTNHGFRVLTAKDGRQALDLLAASYVDLIISDIMMPSMDGFTFIDNLRKSGFDQPILIISAKSDYKDKERGFRLGVDDYMVKPIDVNEMLLRVEALFRRAQIASEREIIIGDTILRYDELTISFNGTKLLLPQKEFLLLYKLLSYPNKIFTRQQLMDEIWGYETETDERTVDVHINRLREKLSSCRDFEIKTIRGLGYRAVKSDDNK